MKDVVRGYYGNMVFSFNGAENRGDIMESTTKSISFRHGFAERLYYITWISGGILMLGLLMKEFVSSPTDGANYANLKFVPVAVMIIFLVLRTPYMISIDKEICLVSFHLYCKRSVQGRIEKFWCVDFSTRPFF